MPHKSANLALVFKLGTIKCKRLLKKKNLAVFASGSGSNAENIARYFSNHPEIKVSAIFTNNKNAYVIERAKSLGIPFYIFDRKTFYESDEILNNLKRHDIDLIVLAGFLWLVPSNLLQNYPGQIVNIHPALLPKYGGKGMYGSRVHQAVIDAGELQSGITIHYVNDRYDEGRVIFQTACDIVPGDTPESVAEKVHKLEYRHYPKVIEDLLMKDKK